MAWTVLISKAGSMSNPFEFQEIMAAAMQFGTTKTVEEVVAEQEWRHDNAQREAKLHRRPTPAAPQKALPAAKPAKPASTRPPQVSELAKARALYEAGRSNIEARSDLPPTE